MKICRICQKQYSDDVTVCPDDKTDLHSATDIKEGTKLGGKYEILSKLGEGGMGAVFKAKDIAGGNVWALKVVAQRLVQEPGFRQRFKSEALIMQALNHPNDVRVQEYGETEDGLPFTVMEFVDGVHLDQLQPAGSKMDVARAVNLVAQLIDGLGAAHKLGIIHRDVKPANILVAKDADGKDVVKLLDFGVAKVKEHGTLYATSKTAAGVMIGTPAYMSPEQVKGVASDQLDGRVDLYASGIILYELLCGRGPFIEKKPVMMLMAHAATPCPNPQQFRKDLSPALSAVLLKVLEKEPAKRFADAAEMHAALDAALTSPGVAPSAAAPAAQAPAAVPAAAAPAAPARPAPPPAAAPPPPPPPPRAAAPPPPPPPPTPAAQAKASDPDITAELGPKYAPPVPVPAPRAPEPSVPPSHSSYAGQMPKARGAVQHKPKRHWGRILVILVILAAILAGLIWLLAPKIRSLSRSSQRQAPAHGMQVVRLASGANAKNPLRAFLYRS